MRKEDPGDANLTGRGDSPRCCCGIADIMGRDANTEPPGRVPGNDPPDCVMTKCTVLPAYPECVARRTL